MDDFLTWVSHQLNGQIGCMQVMSENQEKKDDFLFAQRVRKIMKHTGERRRY